MYESQCLYGTKFWFTLESGSKIPLKGLYSILDPNLKIVFSNRESILFSGVHQCLAGTPSVSKQKLCLDISCVTKQKIRLVKFLSNFVKRTGTL